MKSKLRKLIAFILVIVLGAAAAVTGFAVSAATDATVSSTEKRENAPARSALRDGIWQVLYKTGVTRLIAVDSVNQTVTAIEPDNGSCQTASYEYIDDLELYKIHTGDDSSVNRRVIANNGNTAAVSNEDGDVISLFYIDAADAKSFEFYTLNQLGMMARGCFEKEYGSSDGMVFSATMNADGSFYATINGMKGDKKEVTYTVDMLTGKGLDGNYETVDLSKYAE
ncbi:hypothetical protein [Ruminococcus sp.]|uniref:hypothetical protein n=1 Tax=Ruminococcus sp. TaxID=41978 RepID=UPI0038708DF9